MFKNIFSKVAFVLLGGILTITSCTEKFTDMNKDPNSPSAAQAEWLLTAAEKTLADVVWDEWNNGRTGMYYAQYFSATSYTEESRYQIREGVNNSLWSDLYAGVLADLMQANELSTTDNQKAIIKLLQAYAFHQLTDVYGDVPFSDALQGMEVPSPKYDAQSDIYAGLITMIDEAVAMFDVAQTSFGAGDIIYGGDTDMWKMFASSLKLRIALRMSDVNPTAAKAAGEAAASTVFTSNGEEALFRYLGGAPNNNPQQQNWVSDNRQDYSPSKTLIDYMLAVSDPRISAYAAPAKNSGTYIGLEYGLDNANATAISNDDVSMPSTGVVEDPTAPAILISYAEVEFALAEAIERGWSVGGTAAAHYEAGIRASMAFWGVEDATAIDAYVAANPYGAGAWKDVIGTQKWLAMYMQGLQAWSERLRLDFNQPDGTPLFVFPVDGAIDANITTGLMVPQRMTYPTDEKGLNEDNLNAAATAMGGDTKAVKMWWDVN